METTSKFMTYKGEVVQVIKRAGGMVQIRQAEGNVIWVYNTDLKETFWNQVVNFLLETGCSRNDVSNAITIIGWLGICTVTGLVGWAIFYVIQHVF